ncbi:ribosome biogenesis factor YjgA [Derxia gummosa]|uniref:Dual-action ribosomal maturation protein DarP n=1 Tax=Derxia gummosa DSM 723 TaxID=1121388 RepID=A0A8B6X0S7_9BURK|nr:ribosome biogenesis factor YjgA [Derxia gummosa]
MKSRIEEMPDDDDDYGPSRSQLKRESEALQAFAEQLVELGKDQLARIDMPDEIATAVRDTQRITAHGGLRRQRQYLGKLMRSLDDETVERMKRGYLIVTQQSRDEVKLLQSLERWRERLIKDDAALKAWTDEYGIDDLQDLRNLIRQARREKADNKPPKAFRELFQHLKATALGGGKAEDEAIDDNQEDA